MSGYRFLFRDKIHIFHISVMSSFAEQKKTIFLLFFPNIISFPFSCQRRNNIFSEQHTFFACEWQPEAEEKRVEKCWNPFWTSAHVFLCEMKCEAMKA